MRTGASKYWLKPRSLYQFVVALFNSVSVLLDQLFGTVCSGIQIRRKARGKDYIFVHASDLPLSLNTNSSHCFTGLSYS